MTPEKFRDALVEVLLVPDPTERLVKLSKTSFVDDIFPEFNQLKMENDTDSRHKDVFVHTLQVVKNTRPTLRLRLAALFHDIAKPATYKVIDGVFDPNGPVTFHYHEVMGADMTREIMRRLKFDTKITDEVVKLVRLHLRVHSAEAWTDKAVRRYMRDAGDLLEDLNHLQRCDVTTRNTGKARRLSRKMDKLEQRIAEIKVRDAEVKPKPALNGREVMEILDLRPGPEVGHILKRLLDNGPMTKDEARSFVLKEYRWLQHLYAELNGYFWIPCPLCGKYFGGHEWKDRKGHKSDIPVGPRSGTIHHGTAICPDCTLAGLGDEAWLTRYQ